MKTTRYYACYTIVKCMFLLYKPCVEQASRAKIETKINLTSIMFNCLEMSKTSEQEDHTNL